MLRGVGGMNFSDNQIKTRLDQIYKKLERSSSSYLGYPCNADLNELMIFSRFLKFPINNVGDPFSNCSFKVNTRELEREVVDFFSKLYNLEDSWGYVTNGGTEGNLYGLFLGRETLGKNSILYYSADSHYSIIKLARLLNLNSVQIKSNENGEINYEDLSLRLKKNKNNPALILATIGTTMKGANDKIEKIQKICENALVSNYYIHVDAALGGMINPFLNNSPKFDFSFNIGSISVSGHKLIGSPIPCGIVLARKKLVNTLASKIEYLETLDTTISGSRNGFTVFFMWYYIKKYGEKWFREVAINCVEKCKHTVKKLNELGWTAWSNEYSNIVILEKPNSKLTEKWQLATQGNIAHIVVMRHTTKMMLDEFVQDLKNEIYLTGPIQTKSRKF